MNCEFCRMNVAKVWALLGDEPFAICFRCYGQKITEGISEIQVPIKEVLPEDWRSRCLTK